MFLKQLELNGFKSFANRTEFEFAPGVTAVVGPNGSGKSNVSDAIRWVLGEQSARTLRGGKMEDVIFAGSESRHPVNYCDVSLTLDNSDDALPLSYDEVTVTRRLYRSGESEYFLNKQLCRLKDITELFMDTGLGKEAYANIGQGRVEEILSSKSEDRRGIFEEAAGIIKFKTRKREAEKKLAETEDNVARLSDLIHELQEQIGPLAEQAEAAKIYRDLQQRLKDREVGLFVFKITTAHREWERTKHELDQLEQEQIALLTKIKQQEAAMEQQSLHLQKLDEQIEQSQKSLLHVSQTLEKAEGQYEVLIERERNYDTERDRLLKQQKTVQARINQAEANRSGITCQLKEKEAQITSLRQELTGRENQLLQLAAGAEEQLEERKAEMFELLGEIASLKNDLQYRDRQSHDSTQRRRELDAELKKARSHEQDIEHKIVGLENEHETARCRLQSCRSDYESLQQARHQVLKAEQENVAEFREVEQRLNNLSSRRDVLQEMETDFSGFFQGVKETLKAREKRQISGVEGAVAELIQVPQEFETAMESVLGGALQHIVVADDEAGRACIQFLKKQRLGRATFLPMNIIKTRKIAEKDQAKLEKMKGYIGIAVNLVEFDQQYHHIIASLLGQVVVAQNMVDANRIAKQLRYRARVVTLDGDIVNPGGSMSGGALRQKRTNLLGRKRELEELDRNITRDKTRYSELKQRTASLDTEKRQLEEHLEEIRSQGETLRLHEQKVNNQLEQAYREKEAEHNKIAVLQKDVDHLANEDNRLEQERKQIQAELAQKNEQEQQFNRDLSHLEQRLRQQKDKKETESAIVTDLKVNLAQQEQEYEYLYENRERYFREMAELQQEETDVAQQIQNLENRITATVAEKQACTKTIDQLQDERETVQERLDWRRGERVQAQDALKEIDALNRNIRKTAQSHARETQRQEIKVNRLDVQLNNQLTALSETYEISYELAKERHVIPDDPQLAERDVRKMKDRLSALGEVNLGAIDEHQRVSERLAFLKEQRDDLSDAKASLYQVIADLDKEMSDRFHTAFQQIRQNFKDVFTELFGGGKADLRLTDSEAVLETGIDIVVQPPGKRLQHLSLLSGGERTLTAIGLLFAILRARPVPFCVLDEVEAALDETNVVRFSRYLRAFSQETQFIVITHRKQTMEEAHVLYGVTMQEFGISKLVSVKLDDVPVATDQEVAATLE